MSRDLSAKFASDRSPSAGYHDYLILYITHDLIQIHLDRLPAQQVLDLYLTEFGYAYVSINKLIDSRNDPGLTPGLFADIQDFLHLYISKRRDRYYDLLDIILFHFIRDVLPGPYDRNPSQIFSLFCRIVINDTLYFQVQITAFLCLL